MTKEEAIKKLQKQKIEYLDKWVDFSGVAEAFDMAIKALEQEPCTDAINREETLKALEKSQYSLEFCQDKGIDYSVNMNMVRIVLRNMPPVTPAKKVGQWIKKEHEICFTCNQCWVTNASGVKYNYCPNCGRRMMQEVEE